MLSECKFAVCTCVFCVREKKKSECVRAVRVSACVCASLSVYTNDST